MIGIRIKRHMIRQFIIVITANVAFFQIGVTVGYMSPFIVKLTDENQSPLPYPPSETETAWIMSMGPLASLFGFTYSGYIVNLIGRKYFILIAVLPRIIGTFVLLFASRVWMVYLGRIFCGLSDFSSVSVVSMYASEIASKEIRGGLGAVSQISSGIGSMLLLTTGPFVSYLSINIIQTTLVAVTSVPLLFLPESPYFLYSKGKTDEAIKTLTYIRGDVSSAGEELKEYALSKSERVKIKEILTDKVILKSLGMTIILAICSQMTGYNAVANYLQLIFKSTGTSIQSEVSSAIIGCIQVLGCICTILLTDRFGRKPLLISTFFAIGVGLIGLGAFFKILHGGGQITGFLNYLPLLSLMLVIFCFNAGIGSLVWILMAELFNGPSRAFGVTTGTLTSFTFTFLTIRYFGITAEILGAAVVYWTFAACSIISGLFIAFVVPETKGKAFSQIQMELSKS